MKVPPATILLLIVAAAITAPGAQTLVQIYPSGAAVPENLLRIELRFSTPLRPPLRIDQVKLVDLNGSEIKDAFLDLPLPSPDGKRVTILFHPGRVKSGVGPNLALGRALHVGDTITLVIYHRSLAKPIRKTWHVTAFDAKSPEPVHWTFEPPDSGSRFPLVLHLDKPISSSAEALIAIRDPDGDRLAGDARLENDETMWRFVPARPWRAGNYAVVTHPDLEDLAGNRPCGPFEVASASPVREEQGTVQPFEVSK
jgi:hypothetical protein